MNRLIVQDGKGGRDRATILPEKLIRPLRVSLEKGCRQHEADLAEDAGWVELSHALAVNTAMQDANEGIRQIGAILHAKRSVSDER